MNKRFYGRFYKCCRFFIRLFYRKYEVFDNNSENQQPTVYVALHQNLFGPFIALLSFPKDIHCWILYVFLNKPECYQHYANFTFRERFGWPKLVAKSLAFIVSRFVPALLKSGKHVPVYRGKRKILQTFTESISILQNYGRLIIFPDVEYTNTTSTVGEMYEGFLYLEKYYYKATGKHLRFVPLFVSKQKRIIVTGESISFQANKPFIEERKKVLQHLKQELQRLSIECGDANKQVVV